MMFSTIRKIGAVAVFTCYVSISMAQDPGSKSKSAEPKTESKPFRILTNGKRITIQSNQDINRILVWTTSGHRLVEETNLESPSYNFTIPSTEKYFFVMIQLKNGKYYTEKIGVQ